MYVARLVCSDNRSHNIPKLIAGFLHLYQGILWTQRFTRILVPVCATAILMGCSDLTLHTVPYYCTLLQGIRVLKFYAWERIFNAKVKETREGEVRLLQKLAYLKAIQTFLLLTTPIAVCFSFLSSKTSMLSNEDVTFLPCIYYGDTNSSFHLLWKKMGVY